MLDGLLAAAVEHAVMVTDLSGTVTFFRRGAERMLGYRAEELLGTSGLVLATPNSLR